MNSCAQQSPGPHQSSCQFPRRKRTWRSVPPVCDPAADCGLANPPPPDHDLATWEQTQLARYQPRHVPEAERERYAATHGLLDLYDDCQIGRWERVGRKATRSPYTLQKEKQALRWFARFSRPAEWPDAKEWRGPSLQFIERASGQFWTDIYDRMRSELSAGTIASARSHISAILNHAVRIQAIRNWQMPHRSTSIETAVRILTPDEVASIYQALTRLIDVPLREAAALRTAFVVALHSGLRARDLFSLRWGNLITDSQGRGMLSLQASKTSKLQGIPLHRIAWQHIYWLACRQRGPDDAPLFAGLSAPRAIDPEGSWQARFRARLLRSMLESLGMAGIDCPIHVCRATFNERMESHRPGVARFILGHSVADVNTRHYRSPSEDVWQAVLSFPSYPCLTLAAGEQPASASDP